VKKAFTLVVLIVAPIMVFAQGSIRVANSASALVMKVLPPGDIGEESVAVNGGMVQFFAAADGTAFNPLGALVTTPYRGFALNYSSLAGFLAANSGWNAYNSANIARLPGRFDAGTVIVAPLAAGGNIEYVMIGWAVPSSASRHCTPVLLRAIRRSGPRKCLR
jgi:hypothetical protein